MTFEEVRSLLSTKILRGMRSMHLHLLGNLSSIRLALFTIRPRSGGYIARCELIWRF